MQRGLKQHRERGWDTINTWTVPTGATAYRVEAQVRTWLRGTLKLPTYLFSVEMPREMLDRDRRLRLHHH